jgi:hypothetical protein
MKRLFLLAAMLLAPMVAWGQNTTVTATVTDPTGRFYTFSTGYAALVCPGNAAPTLNGYTVPRTFTIVGFDGNGKFTQVLYDVNSILPAGCGYQWHIVWQDGITAFITGTITSVTGASVNESSAISAFAVPLPNTAGFVLGVTATAPIVSSMGVSPVISCPTCTTSAAALTLNQLILGAGLQAEAALGSLGTTTTLLHGNAAGAPSFSAVNLAADVTGLLPVADLTGQIPISQVGSAGLSGTSPISIAATGVISCSTCSTTTSTFPQVVYSTASTPTTGNLGTTTMATPSANADYRLSFYVQNTVVGTSCAGISQVGIEVTWQDPLAAGTTTFGNGSTQGIIVNLSSGSNNGVVGPASSWITGLGNAAGNTTWMPTTITFRAKSGVAIQYASTAIPGMSCSPAITYQVTPVLEQLTSN